jgi:ribosomal protein S12 methylthiotransferase accessory factor
LQERFAPSNLGFYINDITTDIPVPVIFGLLIDEHNEGLAVAVGASANLDAEGAALKALLEAAQGRLWLKSMKRSDTRVYREDFADIEYFEDHVRLFGSLNSVPYVNFLTRTPADKDIHSVRTLQAVDTAQDLTGCVNVLAAKGFDVIAVNLTQPDVENLGFYVAKVRVPGLVDINPNHNYPHLGGKRLYTVPRVLGYYDRNIREHEMTSIPHPFP